MTRNLIIITLVFWDFLSYFIAVADFPVIFLFSIQQAFVVLARMGFK